MSEEFGIERRLAAVLAADVAGFSRLTEADEIGTMRLLAAQRAILDSAIARHRGRIANTAGDSVLAEFPSAVNAVQCAVEAQQALRDAAEAARTDRRVLFRIGIHVGDVMVRGGDLLGTGVNVAARLEELADAGGIVLSAAAHEQVKKILPLAYTDLGAQSMKNIEEPVRAFAIGASAGPWVTSVASGGTPLPLPDKPSIAVLPFHNMSGDPEQEYFADGMVEDIITALSRFKSLFVIARNSSFTYKAKPVGIKQVGRELGVRYVLEGSVRKAGGRVRINGQLIEAATNTHLWADKFDGPLEDIFELQDAVTAEVVSRIAPSIERAEFARARQKGIENLNAYDAFLRGREAQLAGGRERTDQALAYYYQAIRLDPSFGAAYAAAAFCYNMRKTSGWWEDAAAETIEAKRLCDIAVDLGRDDDFCLAHCALVYAFVLRNVELGHELVTRALLLNPNNSQAWRTRAFIQVWRGENEAVIETVDHAVRLNPRDPAVIRNIGVKAWALIHMRKYDEASALAAQVSNLAPIWTTPMLMIGAVAHAHAGRIAEAKRLMKEYVKQHPQLRLSNVRDYFPDGRKEDTEHMVEGLRLAGLPE